MFTANIRLAVRNLRRHGMQSAINIFGLAIGIAMFLLIMIYSRNELSYDTFHKRCEDIHQVEIGDQFYTTAPLGTLIKSAIPGFETIVRIDYFLGGGRSPLLETHPGSTRKEVVKVKDILFADPALLEMFSFPVVCGNPATALKEPFSIVLTRSTARRLFGSENVLGETLLYIGDRNSQPRMNLTVTAVVEDVPNNSSIAFNAVGSLSTLAAVKPGGQDIEEDWHNWMYATFVMSHQQDVGAFTEQLSTLWLAQENRLGYAHQQVRLIPLADVHFHDNSKRQFIVVLELIGVFILAIGVVNFINLTIARSTTRCREIGIRKVLGSHRAMLIRQLLTESVLTCAGAAVVAVVIIELSRPLFFTIIGKTIPLDVLHQPLFVLLFMACIAVTGVIAGFYPAVVLSAFNPASVLKGERIGGVRGNSLRHGLILFQFAISIALIVCTLLIGRQVEYLRTKDLGFNDSNIMHFNQSQQINQQYEVFKQKLLANPDILGVSRSNTALGQDLPIGPAHEFHGLMKPYRATTVDPDFIPLMKIAMAEGRPFSWDMKGDRYGAMVVNETFVREFELKEPLGAEVQFLGWKARVIGVMKDFHYSSLHQKIEPAALVYADWNSRINIRMSSQNVSRTIHYVRDAWNELSPDLPFEYEFLDQTYGALYTAEEQLQSIINTFSVVAIVIACLGLFGLVSHSTGRRVKEIGVRKTLGATAHSLVFMFTWEFLKWVLLANTLAWPLAWFSMHAWLRNFAYHTDITWWMFGVAGGTTLVIAFLTVSTQAIKAALANPVEALRFE